MKLRALLLVGLLVVILPTPVKANSEVAGQMSFGNLAGLTTSGTLTWWIRRPDTVASIGDVVRASSLMTAPTSTSPAVTWGVQQVNGCTLGTTRQQNAFTTAGSQSSFDWDFTMTDTTCTMVIRLQYTVGAITPTTIFNAYQTLTVRTDDSDCSTGVLAVDARACGASDFQVLTQLSGMEAFTFLAVALAALVIGATSRQPVARFAAAIIVLLLGVLLLSFTASVLVVLTAGAMLLFAALIFLQAALEWTRSRKPKKGLFE